jgi:hypothetical protein
VAIGRVEHTFLDLRRPAMDQERDAEQREQDLDHDGFSIA